MAALVLDREGYLLVCERLHFVGAWQFPQGGIDPGESPENALRRELFEEVGLEPSDYEIGRMKAGYRYDFPPEISNHGRKWKFKGQTQTYFECRLTGEGRPAIDLTGKPQEFKRAKWIKPADFKLEWLPEFKRAVYQQVMFDFFEVDFGASV